MGMSVTLIVQIKHVESRSLTVIVLLTILSFVPALENMLEIEHIKGV